MSARTLVETIRIPAQTGKGFIARKGQIVRMTQKAGPQVIDFNAFNVANPREYFWAGRTRIIEGAHLTTGNRLWSVEPWMRPMFTIIEDTVGTTASKRGGRYHDLWYPRCNRRYHQEFFGENDRPNCHMNLKAAAEPFGIGEELIHDTFNIFMRTGLDPETDRYFAEPTDSTPDDYVDLRAEMDCVVAISACPGHVNPRINDVVIEVYDPS